MITTSIICAIGCIVADKLFARIGFIERFVESLPLGREE